MKITKYGHACLFVSNGNETLVIDPGKLTELPKDLTNIRTVVVSEDHMDHFDVDNLKKILEQSPNAQIFTSESVGKELDKASIPHHAVSGQESVDQAGFNITLSEGDHAIVHGKSPNRVVTVRVGDLLYYPSDSFIPTSKPVKVLALPTSGPWHKLTEAIDFANGIEAEYIIATHNGLHSDVGQQVANGSIGGNLANGQELIYLEVGQSKDFPE